VVLIIDVVSNGYFYGLYKYLLARGYQSMKVVEDGYEFFADRKLVTIFSAPNYCGEFDNSGNLIIIVSTTLIEYRGITVQLYVLHYYSMSSEQVKIYLSLVSLLDSLLHN
jgi:hypothetical protein